MATRADLDISQSLKSETASLSALAVPPNKEFLLVSVVGKTSMYTTRLSEKKHRACFRIDLLRNFILVLLVSNARLNRMAARHKPPGGVWHRFECTGSRVPDTH